MDKEMKAKVDEFLKTNGRRELSLDELEQVSGGFYSNTVPEDFRAFGLTEAEAGSYLQAVYDQFGLDVAASLASEVWGETKNLWHDYLVASAGRNAGYYAVGMIWQKIYNRSMGGNGY